MNVEKSLIEMGFKKTGNSFTQGTGYLSYENDRVSISLQVYRNDWNLYAKRLYKKGINYGFDYTQRNAQRLNKEKLLKYLKLEKEF